MAKVSTGSIDWIADTPAELLDFINCNFDKEYYNLKTTTCFNLYNRLRKKYFYDGFIISKDDAIKLLEYIDYYSMYKTSMIGIILRAKIKWYVKYGDRSNLFIPAFDFSEV